MTVKDLIANLQKLTEEEKDMPIAIRLYDNSEQEYYFLEVRDLYGDLLITTTHPIYDYYEYMPERLRNGEDDKEIEVIVLE